jgi:hypothetical protein
MNEWWCFAEYMISEVDFEFGKIRREVVENDALRELGAH